MRTLKDLAEEAIVVQDACNLSGVIHSWSESIRELRRLKPELDTVGINTHPINQLFAYKVWDLSQIWVVPFGTEFHAAYTKCRKLAEPDTQKEKK